jgi:hyperosmotically inducible periplasmic protein
MRSKRLCTTLLSVLAFGALWGCSSNPPKSPDVVNQIRNSLSQAGLKDVNVSQDRDKGVVTLTGTTQSDADKAQAESVAKSIASTQVVANEIQVQPAGDNDASNINSDLDKGIEKNLDAALTQHKLQHEVKYDVKNGVITLKGTVNSESQRERAEKIASSVPNVKQVVNELELKNQKASKPASSSSD